MTSKIQTHFVLRQNGKNLKLLISITNLEFATTMQQNNHITFCWRRCTFKSKLYSVFEMMSNFRIYCFVFLVKFHTQLHRANHLLCGFHRVTNRAHYCALNIFVLQVKSHTIQLFKK